MSKRLSFSIAVNLLTENFKKGTNTVNNALRSMQMQVLTFAAALGAGGLGISGLLSRFKDVARETSRVLTALKNVSGGTKEFADNLRFVTEMANRYGLEVNALTGNFAKFTASATQANMPIEQQKKVFESLSRASTAFGLSAEDTNGVFLALSQMMGKGKISSEELRKQMGERIPIAMQAMAKATGVSMAGLEKMLKQGRLMSAEVIPKFADALNEMIPNVDTNNLESSLGRLSNAFAKIVGASGFGDKYKALIDGVTSSLESAGKNIQGIIVAIVAAIGFVVTAGLTKVHQAHVATGQRIVANANAVRAKMILAAQSRIAAEKRMEELKLQHAQATGAKQVRIAEQIERQKQLISNRTVAVNRLHEEAKARNAQMAAAKANTYWGRAFLGMNVAAKRLMVSLKTMWNTFSPAIIVSAIIAVVGYFVKIYNEAKRIKNIFADYKKELKNAGDTQEIKMLQTQLSIMNNKTRSQKEVNSAQAELQKMLGKEKRSQEEINKDVAKRIELLRAAAEVDHLQRKQIEVEEQLNKVVESRDSKAQDMASGKTGALDFLWDGYKGMAHAAFGLGAGSSAESSSKEIYQLSKVLHDIKTRLENAVVKVGNSTTIPGEDTDTDDEAKRAAERRLEALRKMSEEERKLQIDKQKFDIEMRQKAIDLDDDSFEKRFKQTVLNLDKERLAVQETQSDLLKKQRDYAKSKYVSTQGKDDGFEAYFARIQKNNFKDQNGVDIMPGGLRPGDIESQVGKLLDAAQAAQRKGLNEINRDFSAMLKEQQLMFASDLDKKLAELDGYYNEQRIKATGNAALIAQIEANRQREKKQATTGDNIKKLDFDEALESERIAALESIGMSELVEEKKLEISKKYVQLKIDALRELADAGDEDANRQIQMYRASLKRLDMQKPAKSLKALADKAIFDTIQKGFEKAGDSADLATEATTLLLGSIRNKAVMIADTASILQSAFGGMNEELDRAMATVGNIANGFAQGGIVGGIAAVVSEGINLFGRASKASAQHKQALREIEDARLASQRAYNLLLREQNLLLEEAVSIFGEKQIERAANAMQNYRKSLSDLKNEMQGGNLAKATIITGHRKTGKFGWGKGKDVYSSILNVPEYKAVIKANGELDREMLKTIISTRKMSDETKQYLQNILDLYDAAQAAQQELRNYLQSTFGALGDDIMTSLENAIKDKGVNAWEAFGEAGAKVIEALGKQIAYELFFAEKFKGLQNQLEAVYSSGKSEEDIARDAMGLVGQFYQSIGSQMEIAQGFMENWQKEAQKHGLSLWQSENSKTQDSTKGYSVSMDQDTGGAILGRITGIHESILEVKSMMSAVNVDTAKCLTQSVAIGDELKKHTGIFYEMQQIQVKSYRLTEKIGDSLSVLSDMRDGIDAIKKNTKGF